MKELLSSRKQIAEHFGVTYNTVQNWDKKGLIKTAYLINGRPRYQLSEVIEAITKKKGGATCN